VTAGPPHPGSAGRGRAVCVVSLAAAVAVLAGLASPGSPDASAASAVPERAPSIVRLEAGARVWSRPAGGTPLARVDSLIELPVLEVLEGWARVRFGTVTGWVPLPTEVDRAGEELRLLPRAADEERLARARALLGGAAPDPATGSLPLYTDVTDPDLLALVRPLLSGLASAYEDRYGLDPSGEPVEALVLFRSDADLDRLLAAEGELRPVVDAGLTRDGIAVTSAGDREPEVMARVLVHEAVHLLNRRVFALPPPIWLEEGMANDLAYSRFTPDGEIVLASLGGSSHTAGEQLLYNPGGWLESGRRTLLSGPAASLAILEASFRPEDLEALLELDDDGFFQPAGRQQRYDLAAFLVRYLLDGAPEERRRAFRDLVRRLADSTELPPTLEETLGVSVRELATDLHAWLRDRLRAAEPTDRSDRSEPPPARAPRRRGAASEAPRPPRSRRRGTPWPPAPDLP